MTDHYSIDVATAHCDKITSDTRRTSTFVASLELAKQGTVSLTQQGSFTPIQVRLTEHVVPLPA